MSDKIFVDTNVLIYAHDVDAGAKHRIAGALLRDLCGQRAGVLGTQVLDEFYANVTVPPGDRRRVHREPVFRTAGRPAPLSTFRPLVSWLKTTTDGALRPSV